MASTHADENFDHKVFQREYGQWKATHNEGESHADHGVTQAAVKDIRNARKVKADAEEKARTEAAAQEAAKVKADTEEKARTDAAVAKAAETKPRWIGPGHDTPEVAALRKHFSDYHEEIDKRFGSDITGSSMEKRKPEVVAEHNRRFEALKEAEQEQIRNSSRPKSEDFDAPFKFQHATKEWEAVHGKDAEQAKTLVKKGTQPKVDTQTAEAAKHGYVDLKAPDNVEAATKNVLDAHGQNLSPAERGPSEPDLRGPWLDHQIRIAKDATHKAWLEREKAQLPETKPAEEQAKLAEAAKPTEPAKPKPGGTSPLEGAAHTSDYETRRKLEAVGSIWEHQFGQPVDWNGRLAPDKIEALNKAGLATDGKMSEAQWDEWSKHKETRCAGMSVLIQPGQKETVATRVSWVKYPHAK